MVKISMREFAHNMAEYVRRAQKGERIVLMKHKEPVVELTPHQASAPTPGWRRKIKKVKVRGKTFASTVEEMRRQERL